MSLKAVIVEIKDSLVAVLTDDGRIISVKNNNYEIGQVIQMSTPKIRFTKKITAFAASAAALVVFGVGSWAYASPYTYVSLDVNPSIEYTVNRFDRVLRVTAVNDDGEEILKKISLDNLDNKTIQAALAETVNQISELGYFDGTIEGGIVIATSGKDTEKAKNLAQELQQTIENEVIENGDDVEVATISVGMERVEQARDLGVTPGKLHLVEKLQAAATDPTTIVLDEWLDKPVKAIMKATKDYKKANDVTDSDKTTKEIEIQNHQDDEQKVPEIVLQKDQKEAQKDLDKAEIAAEKAKKDDEKAKRDKEKAEIEKQNKEKTKKAKPNPKKTSNTIKEEDVNTTDKNSEVTKNSKDSAPHNDNTNNKETEKSNDNNGNSKKGNGNN